VGRVGAVSGQWTDHDLVLAWQAGRDYVPAGVAEAADDLRSTPSLAPPSGTHEERIAERMAEMAKFTAPNPWPGAATRRVSSYAHEVAPDVWEFLTDENGPAVLAEPVPWEGGPDRVPQWCRDAGERDRPHDAEVLEAGMKAQPITDWRDVHSSVTPTVWARIWGDLCDRTRRGIADLDPRRPAGDATRRGRTGPAS